MKSCWRFSYTGLSELFPPAVLGFVKPLYSYFRRAAIDTRVALLLTSAKIPLADAEIETKVSFLWQGGEKRLVLPIPGKSVFLKMHEELEADLRAFHKEKDESCSTQTG